MIRLTEQGPGQGEVSVILHGGFSLLAMIGALVFGGLFALCAFWRDKSLWYFLLTLLGLAAIATLGSLAFQALKIRMFQAQETHQQKVQNGAITAIATD